MLSISPGYPCYCYPVLGSVEPCSAAPLGPKNECINVSAFPYLLQARCRTRYLGPHPSLMHLMDTVDPRVDNVTIPVDT